jgi:hypothetical protein
MVRSGLLKKQERGVYVLSRTDMKPFVPDFNDEMDNLNQFIKRQLPFTEYCVWNISDVKSLAHHVANLDIIFVDVELIAVESVFNHLNALDGERQVYLRPSETDYERYIIGRPTIVVRPLVSQAPLFNITAGKKSVSIEKVLVDAAIDVDFFAFQGSQIYDIYETAFERYDVNQSKMLRYAGRRGKKEYIQQLIKETCRNYDTPR